MSRCSSGNTTSKMMLVVSCVLLLTCCVSIEALWEQPMNGSWSPWSQWYPDCDYVAEGTIQTRMRQCNNPPPINGGLDCEGYFEEEINCPIHGGWSDWSEWSGCTNQCGVGVRTRARDCSNPIPQYDGALFCPDESLEEKDCRYWNFDYCLGSCYFCSDLANSYCAKNESLEDGFYCDCNDGYVMNSNTSTCDDIDECAADPEICGDKKWCENNPGSYRCFCNPGSKINKFTQECENITFPVPCQIVRGKYKCACIEVPEFKIMFHPSELSDVPSPVTFQNGTFHCSCHFCKDKLDIKFLSGVSRCRSVEAYPICKRQDKPDDWGFPIITPQVYDKTKVLEKVNMMTILMNSASNLTSAAFNSLIQSQIANAISGCLNEDTEDSLSEQRIMILRDCDRAAWDMAQQLEKQAPMHSVYINSDDPETDTSYRFSQHRLGASFFFPCNNSKKYDNFIYLPKEAFTKEKQPVLSSCVTKPDRVLFVPTEGTNFRAVQKGHNYSMINSAVISATSWPRILRQPADQPIIVSFTLLKPAEAYQHGVCSWYDFDNERWRRDDDEAGNGCRVHGQNATHVTCYCNHLTNFAVIMDTEQVEESEKKELDFIIYMGLGTCLIPCGITLVCLIGVCCYLGLTPEGLVRMAVTLCLIMGNICILFWSTAMDDPTVCKVNAVAIHAFYTLVMSWMLGLSCYLYVKWCRPVTAQKDNLIRYLPVFAVALVYPVIACSGLVGANHLELGHFDFCWPGNRVDDISVALLMTIVIPGLIAILILLCTSSTATKYFDRKDAQIEKFYVDQGMPIAAIPEEKRMNRSTYLEGMYMVTIVHGLMWVFFVVYMKEYYLTPMYLFSFLNSMEGACIFLFFVVMNPEMKKMLALLRQTYRPRSPKTKVQPAPVLMPLPPPPPPKEDTDSETEAELILDAKFIPTHSRPGSATAQTPGDIDVEYKSSVSIDRRMYDPMDRRTPLDLPQTLSSNTSSAQGRESRWTVPGDLLGGPDDENMIDYNDDDVTLPHTPEPHAEEARNKMSHSLTPSPQDKGPSPLCVEPPRKVRSARDFRRNGPAPAPPAPHAGPLLVAETPGPPKLHDNNGWMQSGRNTRAEKPVTPLVSAESPEESPFSPEPASKPEGSPRARQEAEKIKLSQEERIQARIKMMRAFHEFM